MARFQTEGFHSLEAIINNRPVTILKEYFPDRYSLLGFEVRSISSTAIIRIYSGHGLVKEPLSRTRQLSNKGAIASILVSPEGAAPQATGIFVDSLYISQASCPPEFEGYILKSLLTAYHNAAINSNIRYLYFNTTGGAALIKKAKDIGWSFQNDCYVIDPDNLTPSTSTVLCNMMSVKTMHSH